MRSTVIIFFLVFIASCSLLNKDAEKERRVREFLLQFKADLGRADSAVLRHFQVAKPKEALLLALNVLRNQDSFVLCEIDFEQASVTVQGTSIVAIPVAFRTRDESKTREEEFLLTLVLDDKMDSFVISDINGEAFYSTFWKLKNSLRWIEEEYLAIEERKPIFAQARQLESQFDSVVWFIRHAGQTYFYLVEGDWTNHFLEPRQKQKRDTTVRMGLTTFDGTVILSPDYDLIGTPGFFSDDVVEIKRNGKIGYFDLKTQTMLIEPKFDLVIPPPSEKQWAIARMDTTWGVISNDFHFTPALDSITIDWVDNFRFLGKSIRLSCENYSCAEIPHVDHVGYGVVIPPSYLVANGIFSEIQAGFCATNGPLNAYTEYLESKPTIYDRVTGTLKALITAFEEHYLEGREEFYHSSRIVLLNQGSDTLGVLDVPSNGIEVRLLDSTTLEVKAMTETWWMNDYQTIVGENVVSVYFYYRLNHQVKPEKLKSRRLFPQTEFTKLDSSYVMGNFSIYSQETKKVVNSSFLSATTIAFMRDEILASYGYQFAEPNRVKLFQNIMEGYSPEHESIGDFESMLTETDQFNLVFLNSLLPAKADLVSMR